MGRPSWFRMSLPYSNSDARLRRDAPGASGALRAGVLACFVLLVAACSSTPSEPSGDDSTAVPSQTPGGSSQSAPQGGPGAGPGAGQGAASGAARSGATSSAAGSTQSGAAPPSAPTLIPK